MECAAKEYGDCVYWGKKEVDVLFLYRDNYGTHLPDETVKVCMCEAHRSVLEKYHEGRPLEMRGEEVDWALYNDLFSPFSSKHNTYTYVKIHMKHQSYTDRHESKFALVNGRDIEKFRELMTASDPEISYITEESIFLTRFNTGKDEEEVIEMNPVTCECDIDILKKIPTYYKPALDYKTITWEGLTILHPREEKKPTMETEYTIETVLPCVQKYFAQKWEDKFRANFKECLGFMTGIDNDLVDIENLRKTSPHSEDKLFTLVRRLTDALWVDDRGCISEMKNSGEISEEVLWVTYVMANHELFWSSIPGRELRTNIPLIKLFIDAGLHGNLLLLAVSGERERCLDIHHRTQHNILHDNVYVVRYLVPKHFQPRTMVVLKRGRVVTYNSAYKYYTEFSNELYNCNPHYLEEPFEKNEYILLHLLKCIVEENTAFLKKSGFEEGPIHKVDRMKYETLLAKMKEENEKCWYDKYVDKEELDWKNAIEKEGV